MASKWRIVTFLVFSVNASILNLASSVKTCNYGVKEKQFAISDWQVFSAKIYFFFIYISESIFPVHIGLGLVPFHTSLNLKYLLISFSGSGRFQLEKTCLVYHFVIHSQTVKGQRSAR